MFEPPEEPRLTSRAVGYFAAAPAVFSFGCLVASKLFTLSDLTNELAGLIVYVFLVGYPILLFVELLCVLNRFGDPITRRLGIAALLLAAGAVTWIATVFLAFHLLPFRT